MEIDVQVGTRRSDHHTDNQDRAVVGRTVISDAPSVRTEHLAGPTLVAVLDGLGGHPAGDLASQLAGEAFANADVPTDERSTAALLQHADEVLHRAAEGDVRRAGMGTTAAMVAIADRDGVAVVANVGDSSVWRLTGAGLEELTESDRVFGSTILQCLGANGGGVEPHIRSIDLHRGDRVLLASDGLTDVVAIDQIETVLREDPDHAVGRLMQTVESAGPPDDVTIVLLDVVSA